MFCEFILIFVLVDFRLFKFFWCFGVVFLKMEFLGVCGDWGEEGLFVIVYKVFEVVWVLRVIFMGLEVFCFELIEIRLFYLGVLCVFGGFWCFFLLEVIFVIVYEVLYVVV